MPLSREAERLEALEVITIAHIGFQGRGCHHGVQPDLCGLHPP